MLGPAGIPLGSSGGVIEGIKYVNKIGLQAMEIEFVRSIYMSNELAKRVGEVAGKEKIALSIHAPYYINLCNPEKLEASKKRIIDSCERAFHLGARIVVFHPGYYSSLSKQEAFECVLNACKEISEEIDKEVFLGLETTGKSSQFGTLEEIIKICKKIRQCRPVIDFAHVYARNNGKIDYNKIFDEISNFDFIHAHFSGIEFNEKGEKRHLQISGSKPDFKELARVILKRRIKEITIISESPLLEKDAIIMKKCFEGLGYNFKK